MIKQTIKILAESTLSRTDLAEEEAFLVDTICYSKVLFYGFLAETQTVPALLMRGGVIPNFEIQRNWLRHRSSRTVRLAVTIKQHH